MDDVARHNAERWRQLAQVNALFTRPYLDLTPETARERIDPEGLLGDIDGRDVLCLAGGGGQQSAAFALLGANVTVVDLSEEQLQRDREAARHYGASIRTVCADMRDLSALAPAGYEIVYQPYSLGFVPDARVVFAQVARVLRPGGTYFFAVANPFVFGVTERDWNGEGYTLKHPYVDGAATTIADSDWMYDRPIASQPDAEPAIPPAIEYRQTLARVLNGLVDLGFILRHMSDQKDVYPDSAATGGTWDHFVSVAPPWLAFWLRYQPARAG